MNGYVEERVAIETRMNSLFSAVPIFYENNPIPERQEAYGALYIRRGEGNQVSMGDGAQLHRWTNLIMIQFFVPEDTGTQAIAGFAELAAAVFHRATFSAGTNHLIRCRTAKAETIGTKNGWFQINVTVPYQRDKTV